MKNTLVVNLNAGPGTGKSTFAAGIFSKLKLKGIDCELVTEFAKDIVWEDSLSKLGNQIYVFGKQHQRIFRLLGKVSCIITDSPIIMQLTYSKDHKFLNDLIVDEHRKLNTFNIFLKRQKEYNPNGRTQTFEQAVEKDMEIKAVLDKYCSGDYIDVQGYEANIDMLVDMIIEKLS